MQRSEKKQSKYKLYAAFAVRNRSGQIYNGPTSNDQHIYELNFAVRNRSGKIFNGPTRSSQNTTQHSRSGIGLESSATVRQEAVKIQAKRNTRGPESVRKVLQRSEKKQSKYKLNTTLAVRNRSGKICNGPKRSTQNTSKTQPLRSGIGPESFDMVGKQPASSSQRGRRKRLQV